MECCFAGHGYICVGGEIRIKAWRGLGRTEERAKDEEDHEGGENRGGEVDGEDPAEGNIEQGTSDHGTSGVTESVEDNESGIHKVVFVKGARVGEDDTDDADETGCADTSNATTYEEHGHVLGSSAEGGTDQEDDEGAL